ncbi:MAG: integration host factor, actinobacterial type [Acidimicrobiales bacterium]
MNRYNLAHAQPPRSIGRAARRRAGEGRRSVGCAELKERLKMGSISLAEVFEKAESDDVVGKLKVLALLESLPGVGKVKARRKMDEITSATPAGCGVWRAAAQGAAVRVRLLRGRPDHRHLRPRRRGQGHHRVPAHPARRGPVVEPLVDHP